MIIKYWKIFKILNSQEPTFKHHLRLASLLHGLCNNVPMSNWRTDSSILATQYNVREHVKLGAACADNLSFKSRDRVSLLLYDKFRSILNIALAFLSILFSSILSVPLELGSAMSTNKGPLQCYVAICHLSIFVKLCRNRQIHFL